MSPSEIAAQLEAGGLDVIVCSGGTSVRSDAGHVSGCTHCNRCVGAIGSPRGLHCVEQPDGLEPGHQ
ncbi:MAG: hypothetical protein AAF721_34670 [Myxococcota bacterium]